MPVATGSIPSVTIEPKAKRGVSHRFANQQWVEVADAFFDSFRPRVVVGNELYMLESFNTQHFLNGLHMLPTKCVVDTYGVLCRLDEVDVRLFAVNDSMGLQRLFVSCNGHVINVTWSKIDNSGDDLLRKGQRELRDQLKRAVRQPI